MLKRIVLKDPVHAAPLVFENPGHVYVAETIAEVLPALRAAEEKLNADGGYLAGYLGFDAAPAFDSSFVAHSDGSLPMLCLGHFHEPAKEGLPSDDGANCDNSGEWKLDTTADAYTEAIERIHGEIARGNTYQINYTVRYRSTTPPSPKQLFAELGRNARYGAHLQLDGYDIVSASPELFFSLNGSDIFCKPMKGTAMRGLSRHDDVERRDALKRSEKDRAENIMITDMVRNDLGRIAQAGSVLTTELCAVEKHPTVWQMTSTVQAKTTAGMCELFTALFPSASVTGAPKSASLRLIHELENSPRGIYTGAIGYFSADRRAQFNVAIRTAIFDTASNTAAYGVGSGIIWDSVASDEFRECQLKAEILQSRHQHPSFALLETMRWCSENGIALLDEHLQRLEDSADYFARPFDREHIVAALENATRSLQTKGCRLRLLLREDGSVDVQSLALPTTANPFRVRLARHAVDKRDPFLYHKTTHRDVYARVAQDSGDCDDVLLWNSDGHVTETTIANVFVKRDGVLITPPIDCGLLAGVMRANVLSRPGTAEGLIHRDELKAGDELLLSNALRGEFLAVLVD